tara:strand:- start:645 stop:1049 length:405 start_codon:yes stop_codon:yes gene_type:complete
MKKKTPEEIIAQIEIDKINAKKNAKEIASNHLGKHAINYITILVIIGVVSSQFLEGGALTAVIGLVSTAAMALIGILQHIVGAVEKEEKPELEIIKSLIKELSEREEDPMQVDVTDTDVTVTKGESKVTASKKK